MTPLEWTWTLRFGPHARATLVSQPQLFVFVLSLGGLVALTLHHHLDALGSVAVALGVAVLLLGLVLVVVATGLRRLRRVTGATVQHHRVDAESIALVLGRDRQSLPRADLSVVRSGRDWIALRRRESGGRQMILFFDDPGLVRPALAVLRPTGPPRKS